MITFLSCSTNNRAETMFQLFRKAAMEFGIPSCVQSEKGENIMICHFMVPFRGPGRGSHIAGFSVHNQRIERLWRDVCWCVCCLFHEILYFLSVQRKKWSPHKIWVNRMIDPARRNLTAVADVVNGTLAPDDLGINCEGPLPDEQTHSRCARNILSSVQLFNAVLS